MLRGKEKRCQTRDAQSLDVSWGRRCLCALGAVAQACKTTHSVFAAHNVHHAVTGGYKGYFSL